MAAGGARARQRAGRDQRSDASYLHSWIAVLKRDRREIFHAAAGYRTYIITTRQMTSGELLKYRNGLLIARV
jgi:antirestriction protein ArdC